MAAQPERYLVFLRGPHAPDEPREFDFRSRTPTCPAARELESQVDRWLKRVETERNQPLPTAGAN